MISQIVNMKLYNTKNSAISDVTVAQFDYVMKQLKAIRTNLY
ncbi:MAG: hypothetical protein K0S91_92 [Nitrososphaeraceae archaeon]|jgi:hypothetical protein|nr:hypothetical protein [Nitrososphaeraceae archaeon]